MAELRDDIDIEKSYSFPEVAKILGYKTTQGASYVIKKFIKPENIIVRGTPIRKVRYIKGSTLINYIKSI